MPSPKYPFRLKDANGLTYTLKRQPRVEKGQAYPALYTHNGKQYFPDLGWVVVFERGSKAQRPPVMLAYQ